MSENKFLRNLNQQNSQLPAFNSQAVEPAATQPVGVPHQSDYDPIKRLTDELSRHSRAIEGLSTRIDRMEGRPKAATQAELQALLYEAREGVSFTPNSEEIARYVLPELTNGLPTAMGIRAAAEAGASTISSAGETAATRIEGAATDAVSRIKWASKDKADGYAEWVGFTSWKSTAVVFLGYVVLIVGFLVWDNYQEEALLQAKTQTQAVREFTDWVKAQPEGKKLYDRYYNR